MILLASIAVLYSVQPFRSQSDNTVVVAGQAVVYLWVYALLIRIMGIGGETPTFIGGVSLVAVTVALFALALHSMYTDIRAEEASSRHESPETELTELNFEESQNCQGLKDDSSEAGRGGAPRPEPPPPHSFQAEDDQQSCMGSLVLCSAEPQQRTTVM